MHRKIVPPPGGLSRRKVLAAAGLCVTALALPRTADGQTTDEGVAADGFRLLTARPSSARLRGGSEQAATPIWAYGGGVPGPLLRLKRGAELKVRLRNALPQATAIHWQGVRLPNAMDGVPRLTQTPVDPGASFDYRFAPPDAGTFLYQAATAHADPLALGLVGPLIVDETDPPDVDRDILLTFGVWFVDQGEPSLDFPVRTNERVRLRLINGGPRLIALRIDRHRPFVMAIDGQPAEPYAARDARVLLGPGNRMDLFFDAELPSGSNATIFVDNGSGETPAARLVYASDGPTRPAPRGEPRPLPANPLPQRMDFARASRRELPLDQRGAGWIAQEQMLQAALGGPQFTVKRGRTVMLTFPNRTPSPYSMHLHGHHFRLLDKLDDGWKPFWLDTLVLPPGQTERIAFVADNPGKWLITCRSWADRQPTWMTWFEVN
jgi:FtsP/CotA-like multicopper oxidase with cupredoxin domain